MKSLKEKFGKFEMSKEQVKAVKGGRCPSHLSKPGGCEAYWGSDSAGAAACRATCMRQQ
jgi:hypothetical protein